MSLANRCSNCQHLYYSPGDDSICFVCVRELKDRRYVESLERILDTTLIKQELYGKELRRKRDKRNKMRKCIGKLLQFVMPRCYKCSEPATKVCQHREWLEDEWWVITEHACDAHAIGHIEWNDLKHASIVREALTMKV